MFQIVNNRDNNRTQNFTYDALNRIKTAATQGTSGSTCWGQMFGHMNQSTFVSGIDLWGNLNEITNTQCSVPSFTQVSTVQNQISGFCYDIAGNLLSQTAACPNSLPYYPAYVYDAENRLRNLYSSTAPQYLYDGDGKRVVKTGVGNMLYWTGTGSNTLTETNLSGTMTADYIYFNGKRVARIDLPGGTVRYYFSDHLGTASIVTDNLGVIKDESDYYPYGGERVIAHTDSNRYKFTSKERDSESGLDMFGARYYGSSLGRFITPDWATKPTAVPYAHYGNPQSLNLYSYVNNNPTTTADPDGHCPGDIPNCQELPTNPLSRVSADTKQAINNSVKASNRPTTDDKKGGSHEEGGSAWTKNGTQTVAPAQPGAYKDVKQPGVAEISPLKAADPSKQKPDDVKADVEWHVHPSGQVTETTGSQSTPGTVVFGGTVSTTTYRFNQPPSAVDIQNAGGANLDIVVGARDKTVYVYDSSGCTCKESLKDFNKGPDR